MRGVKVKARDAKMTRKKPCEILRDLRERTGLSGSEIARRAQYKSASGYLRWENPEKKEHQDRLIPYHVVQQLLPIFVGKGHPPVTHDEMLAISDAKSIPADIRASFGAVSKEYGEAFQASRGMPIRFTVQKGVYVDLNERQDNESATSPMLPSLEFASAAQFVVSLGQSRGTLLHCVEPDQISHARVVGKRVLVGVERNATGLYEKVLGRAISVESENWRVETADGRTVVGKPLAVVIWSYVREV